MSAPRASVRALANVIERSARVQGPAAQAYVERLRRAHPDAGPAEIVAKLEARYLAAALASGVAVGAVAAFPGIGTLTAAAGETLVFLEATALFVLALAAVYDVPADHRERRHALVLAVLVGDDGKRALAELVDPARAGVGWLSEGLAALPLSAVSQVNWRLLNYVGKRYTLRRGALLFGKLLPLGVGAAVGGAGNRVLGKRIVGNARTAFGAPPARWPVTLRLLPAVPDVAG